MQPSGDRAFATFSKSVIALCLLGTLSLLTACTLPGIPSANLASGRPAAGNAGSVSAIDRSMFDDLGAVVEQIFEPFDTTLQINRQDNDARMQYLLSVLAAKGFGIQRVSADQGANYLSYVRTQNDDDEIRLSITIGAVVIGRDYELVRRNAVTPVSRVRLSGTRVPVSITDRATASFQVRDPDLATAQYVASLGLEEQSPVISLITPELVGRVANVSTSGPSLQALNSSQVEVNNLFYGDTSTFASILDDHVQVDRQVIVFGNDSMVLGDTNKQLIDQFVDTRVQPGDLISLVGCSNGPTALEIGNEGLALGRAKRVTEALMARGVARERVLDEGCWAPTSAGARFPSRGVVMELWRSNT
jgi:hypothetical protein